ncbi:MAG: hypothetical protein J7L45_03045 [Candidatus Aenigmarchaeota archaeon]|nr:hypothetical protein [Candidatus Aenigmarchaeota archaeon]
MADFAISSFIYDPKQLLFGGDILLILDNLSCCKRCGSSDTRTEILIPDRRLKSLKGKEFDQPIEIFCRKCGKIDRTTIKMKIE